MEQLEEIASKLVAAGVSHNNLFLTSIQRAFYGQAFN
jgi:hypothetical protein